jgi:hypothetical protein
MVWIFELDSFGSCTRNDSKHSSNEASNVAVVRPAVLSARFEIITRLFLRIQVFWSVSIAGWVAVDISEDCCHLQVSRYPTIFGTLDPWRCWQHFYILVYFISTHPVTQGGDPAHLSPRRQRVFVAAVSVRRTGDTPRIYGLPNFIRLSVFVLQSSEYNALVII